MPTQEAVDWLRTCIARIDAEIADLQRRRQELTALQAREEDLLRQHLQGTAVARG